MSRVCRMSGCDPARFDRLTCQFDIHMSCATHLVKSTATTKSTPAHQTEVQTDATLCRTDWVKSSGLGYF
ncbi:hypothetical protein E2C01_058296 [Portunus trituberculatus]|uniref:Uncharacterized protein n=1 Tax=Portunus trituberculatus TaxID=210409 RepID=A0A5B7H3C5_PORTR|nr:hypothetical protein [Portunus trituberculatus]